jgi:integrase
MAAGKLSDRKVKALREPGRYGDGATLYLVVAPGGSKQWVQRLTVRGKQTDIGLGGYPVVGLRDAREKAHANRTQAQSGADPLLEKRRAAVPTFRNLAAQHIEALRPSWRNAKHAAQWGSTLAAYAYPSIGDRPVDRITRADVIGLLSPIWTEKPETARRVRQRVRAVMARAIALEYIEHNPASEGIDAALARLPRVKAHHAALPYPQVPAALRAVRESAATPTVKLGFEFLALTACRSGEVRGARWEEVDPDAAAWTVPAARMKGGRPHRVPLSAEAIAVLAEARGLDNGSGLVFPAPRSGAELSNMAFAQLLRRLGLDFVPHGLRSSFRDWAAEQTNAPHAVMEAALAHSVKNSTEAAYFRSDLFELRRGLMAEWGRFLGEVA